ncbi:MAG TPA: IPT/TIG domain-containing protein [Acidimicrobiales bacterium]|nr:IPT/TIG domain-containing protein [Acidimicrobiales bacterium]
MTDVPPPDPTEELLRGADRPRPLPPDLRQRLADRLMAAEGAGTADITGARPLPTDLRARLADALPSPAGPAEDIDGDDGDAPSRGPRRARRWVNPASAVAAALLVVAAVVGLSVRGGGSNNQPTAASNGASKSARAATPQLSASPNQPAASAGNGGGAASGGSSSSSGAGPTGLPSTGAGVTGGEGGAAAGGTQPAAAPAALPPSVSGVAPASGPAAGGTWVIVTGQNLGPATGVRFGTAPARQLVVVSATELRALSPAHSAGTVDVTVVTAGGASAVSPGDRYTFLP